ncbi:hypothetical protein C2G38_2152309 [Gigaspora rosea]|uniref:Uncharacterized protein n=1 Tax=Gigaspora rosea TaxID=44941 RepID=A0A397WA16_9GLOM|nr:hypothetical protein C2G38_2152309 [Gigaspora rosea]
MSICNNLFKKQSEKIGNSSDINQIVNNVTQIYLEDNKSQDFSQDFFNEIIKEMCNLFNEEILKGINPASVLDILEQFLKKKKPDKKRRTGHRRGGPAGVSREKRTMEGGIV